MTENRDNKRLRIAIAGCGNRARVYANLMTEQPDKFQIVAAADTNVVRVREMKRISGDPDFIAFDNTGELLNSPRLADVLVIATQDNYHYEPCLEALKQGYDIVLEKPMSVNIEEILRMEEEASRLGKRVIVCHVLRYTSFYRKLREIIQTGQLGEVITMNASEGIGPWHFAHSYVRGHWAKIEDSTPTIVAKCCHDMDILHWLISKKCISASSFGSLSFFRPENRHLSGQYPMFNASRYLEPGMKGWLAQVYDMSLQSRKEITEWLKTSKWGRNVFECDNNAIDHQVINLKFEDDITATFTMSAFDEGRNYEINGTRARLRAGDFYKEHLGCDIIITEHATNNTTKIEVIDQNPHPEYGGYHGGGDVGFIKELHHLMTCVETPLTSISESVHSHLMAFAAEESRVTGKIVDIEKFTLSKKSTEYALD